jgi:hypothetical protein
MMNGDVKAVAAEARETGVITFGGEYHFLTTSSYQAALRQLQAIAGQIGGLVSGNGNRIEVHDNYDSGYWAFYWMDVKKGVRKIVYWQAHEERL